MPFFQVTLNTSQEQFERLEELQKVFASVCNAIAPVASGQRCWNRVALHHLVYRDMRAQFPALGSQMVCNAIYAVCKISRMVYQHPNSPFHVKKMGAQPLPKLNFADACPVYFDAHTLTLLEHKLSLYTMDGRIKFLLTLTYEQQSTLGNRRLIETVLNRNSQGHFMLTFVFEPPNALGMPVKDTKAHMPMSVLAAVSPVLPSYVKLEMHS